LSDSDIDTGRRQMTVLTDSELHNPGGDVTDDICERLLTAEERGALQDGGDETEIRQAMFRRLMPSMLEEAISRFRDGAGRGVLVWCQDASVRYIPECRLTNALGIRSEIRAGIERLVARYRPESEAILISERSDSIELRQLGPGEAQRSLGIHLIAS
jgi:hypothetical protein